MTRVVITGLGMITPVGVTTEESWQGFKLGKSGTGFLTQADPSQFNSKVSAEVKNFDPSKYFTPKETKKSDRFVQFAVATAHLALKDAVLDPKLEDPYRIGVLVGSGIGGLRTIEEQHKVLMEKGAGS